MTLKVGDIVRVREPDGYLAAYARKIRNRDAVVVSVAQDGLFKGSARVRFLKRNGRGKEFEERILISELAVYSGSSE